MGRPFSVTPPEWMPLIEACGGKKYLAQKLDVAESTLHRWVTAEPTDKHRFPMRARAHVGAVARALGVANPCELQAREHTSTKCPRCKGLGLRPMTPSELSTRRAALGPAADDEPEIVDCECQAP